MHVAAIPLLVELPPGQPAQIVVSITNTSSLIDAYSVRAFGLDPRWVTVTPGRVSLFPSEVGTIEVAIALPEDFPAGLRHVAVHVQSESDPAEFSLAQLTLDVGTRARTTLRVDPVAITGGNHAQFALIVGNEGNATVQVRPQGLDPEDVVDIAFEPPTAVLPPARREVVRADVTGGRPWFGQPKPRVLSFSLGPDEPPAMATFVQRPRIGRWLISLLGLATVAAIFAVVLSTVMDRLVAESKVDDELLNEALTDGEEGGASAAVNPTSVTGRVIVASTGTGVAGVQVELFSAGNGEVPLGSAATESDGAYTFGRLAVGRYRLRFTGAGFDQQWYIAALTHADATDIDVEEGQEVELEDLELGGQPGSVTGEVVAEDPTGATAQLVVLGVVEDDSTALVEEVPVSADGSFLFESVPSPANYQLVVEKTGFATEVRDVVLNPGQDLDGIEIVLREGDGVVSGRVQSPDGPLGGVTIEATDGTTTVSTVSLTLDDVGFFAVRALPTPGQYTLTFTKDAYNPETRTVNLTAEQPSADLSVVLAPATGSISGTVSDPAGPAGGVTVTVSGPDVEQSTTTASRGDVGSYVFEDLPAPATYTITFSKDGLMSQTRQEAIDPANGRGTVTGVDATLIRSTVVVNGIVLNPNDKPVAGATLVLTDGTNRRQLLSANEPRGRFEFSGVAPGAYTLEGSRRGTSPSVQLVNVVDADIRGLQVVLGEQASIEGTVRLRDPVTGRCNDAMGLTVRLFLTALFPDGEPVDTTTTSNVGEYDFQGLDAPEDYVVAVYRNAAAAVPLQIARTATQAGRPSPVDIDIPTCPAE